MSLITKKDYAQFRKVGYFVTDVMFAADELEPMADEMDRVYEERIRQAEASGDANAVKEARDRRSYGQFHTYSEVAAEFVKSPVYLEACQRLIGPDADLYYNQAASKPPDIGRTFGWHQDSGYTETVPLEYITCWTAISDSTLQNGCIWVIPGSHTWGLLPHVPESSDEHNYGGLTAQFDDERGAIPVEMKAGQVAFFSSLTLHKSGPNTSRNSVRRGYVPQYHVPGVILKKTRLVTGDQYPVLRSGKKVKTPVSVTCG